MKQVKQLDPLDEGYLKLTLTNKKEFDPYMLEELNKQSWALKCTSKKRSATCFLYDVCERISLSRYLQLYEFSQEEAWQFLLDLFEALEAVEQTFPLYLGMDEIFCDQDGREFYFLILPIHERALKHDWGGFLFTLLTNLHICWNTALLADCFPLLSKSDIQPTDVVATLHLWKKHNCLWERIRRFWYRWQKREERSKNNQLRIQEEWTKMRLLQQASQEEKISLPVKQESNTVALFPKEGHAYLCGSDGIHYPLNELNVIGRGESCSLQLHEDTISQLHAQIIKKETGYQLIDLSSSNGTKLNGKKLKGQMPYDLQNGDEIAFATELFQFFAEEEK